MRAFGCYVLESCVFVCSGTCGGVAMNGARAVVVWWGGEGVCCQSFAEIEDAERFASAGGPWAVVISGGQDEFCGSISTHGEYPFPAFGGEV